MNISKLDKLFDEYEKHFAQLDFQAIAQHYPDNFISAGPKGSIAHDKSDFLDKASQASEFYKNIGQHSARMISKDVIHISNEYCLVTVHWSVKFLQTGDEEIMFDVSYLVQEIGDEMKIILFISHEDEMETMKKLGFQEFILK